MSPVRVALLRAVASTRQRARLSDLNLGRKLDLKTKLSPDERRARYEEPTPSREIFADCIASEFLRWRNGYEITAVGIAWLADRRNV